jgi:hypothetical protein
MAFRRIPSSPLEAQPQNSFVDFNGKPEAYRTVLRQSRENKYQAP